MATAQPRGLGAVAGSSVDVADRRDGLFPLGATAAGCNLKKPWRGALNSQLLQFWEDNESKKKSWFEAICFSAVPPALPSMPGILPQATVQAFTQKTIWLSMGEKTQCI